MDSSVHLEERLNIEVFKLRIRRHPKTHGVRKEGGVNSSPPLI